MSREFKRKVSEEFERKVREIVKSEIAQIQEQPVLTPDVILAEFKSEEELLEAKRRVDAQKEHEKRLYDLSQAVSITTPYTKVTINDQEMLAYTPLEKGMVHFDFNMPTIPEGLREAASKMNLKQIIFARKDAEDTLKTFEEFEPLMRKKIEYDVRCGYVPSRVDDVLEEKLASAQQNFDAVKKGIPIMKQILEVYVQREQELRRGMTPERLAVILKRMQELSKESIKIVNEASKIRQVPVKEKNAKKLLKLETSINKVSEEWVPLEHELRMHEETPTQIPRVEHGIPIAPKMRDYIDKVVKPRV